LQSPPAAPTVTAISPTSGPVGTSVVITGTNLTGATVTLSGKPCTTSNASATSITALVPAGATSAPFVVTVGAQTVNSPTFTVTVVVPPAVVGATVTAVELDGTAFTGGLDGNSAYSQQALLAAGVPTSALLTAGVNSGYATGSTVPVQNAAGAAYVNVLGTSVNGISASQMIEIIYTDGTTSTVTQTVSDWHTPGAYPGEVNAFSMSYRDTTAGGKDTGGPFYLYGYALPVTSGKTPASVTFGPSKTFTVLAAVGSQSAIQPVVITPPAGGGGGTGNPVTVTGFGAAQFGNYVVEEDNYGGAGNGQVVATAAGNWTATETTLSNNGGSVTSYPHVFRGWTNNQSTQNLLGGVGWTVKSGMGLSVGAITKARAKWSFTPPSGAYPANRWNALMDNYFHKTNNPDYSQFYPYLDLMVNQALCDQVLSNGSYYADSVASCHGTTVTIGGNTYVTYVDNPGQVFNQPGGHTIWMALNPTAVPANNGTSALSLWGQNSAIHDMKAIINFWMQSNPIDDAGKPIMNAAGVPITSPLITSDLFWNGAYAGFETLWGSPFQTSFYALDLQNESTF